MRKQKSRKRKSTRKSKGYRGSYKCKHGNLKRSVRDKKTGRLRNCKKGPRKSRRRSKGYKKSKGFNPCMKSDKLIFSNKTVVKIITEKEYIPEILKVESFGETLEIYNLQKNIYDKGTVKVFTYINEEGREIVLKMELNFEDVAKEELINQKLQQNNCGVIRLRFIQTTIIPEYHSVFNSVNVEKRYLHYYIMDKFDGDFLDLAPTMTNKNDIMKAFKIISNQLVCLYNISERLWYTDIKCANIFYCSKEELTFNLGDLGSMVKDKDNEYLATFPPPEVVGSIPGYFKIPSVEAGKKIIAWSVGVSILEALESPIIKMGLYYKDIYNISEIIIENNIKGRIKFMENENILNSGNIKILSGLLQIDPSNRKTLEEAFDLIP